MGHRNSTLATRKTRSPEPPVPVQVTKVNLERLSCDDQTTVVLKKVNLVKFKVNCSKNFFNWNQGKTFNDILFDWGVEGDGFLLDNTWRSSKKATFYCPSSKFAQFSRALLMAAADFSELGASEATESSTDDSLSGSWMYDDGPFYISIEKSSETKTIFVDFANRVINTKFVGKGIVDLGFGTDE